MDEKKDLMLDIRDLSVEYRTDEETVKAVERAYEQQLAEKLTKGGLENA